MSSSDSEAILFDILFIDDEEEANSLSDESTFVADDEKCSCDNCLAKSVSNFYFLGLMFFCTAAAIVSAVIVVSFYGVIIINFIFFVSSIVSYCLSPLYHGLSDDWVPFAFAIFQVILASPLVEFYILFIFKSVKYFVGSFSSIGGLVATLFQAGQKQAYIKKTDNEGDGWYSDTNLCKYIGMLFLSFLTLLVSFGAVYVTLLIDKMFILFGMIPYVAIVIQILIIMMPTYTYFFEILFKGRVGKHSCIQIVKDSINDKLNELNTASNATTYTREDAENQTFDSYLNEKFFHNVELSSESSASEGKDKDNDKKKDAAEKEIKRYGGEALATLAPLFTAKEYIVLHEYALDIADDGFHKTSKRVWLWIFTLLNLAVVGFDIWRFIEVRTAYFLGSIILRVIFLPLISYFHLVTIYMYKTTDATLRLILNITRVFTILILLLSVAGFVFAKVYQDTVRINELAPPVPYNISGINNKTMDHPVCRMKYNEISIIDSIGYALGPYDVERNKTVFNNQMSYFFGDDWEDYINYEVIHFNKDTPFIIYNNTKQDTLIFGFRGFSSGPELALQIEMIAAQYVIPFFQDIVPLYEFLVGTFMEYYAKFAHNFGLLFFDPKSMVVDFVDPLLKICNDMNVSSKPNILFTGINIGGAFAKILGMLQKQQAVSFLSMPAFNDFFIYSYDFSEIDATFITNVFNYGGLFALPENNIASNIGIPWVSDSFDTIAACSTEGICELSAEKDSVYRSFCTIADMCGKVEQFGHYCEAVIGQTHVELIHDYLLKEL